jgi:DNA-binding IclR family transcriptional regulator
MPRSRKAAKNVVPAVERAFELLELFRRDTPELPLAEITRRLGLARSSTFRLAFTLERLGYLKRTSGGFQLGPAILSLGFDFLASQELVDFAQPELVKLRDLTDATALLETLEGAEVICIAQAVSNRTLATRVPIGARYPAYANAAGRTLLAELPDDELIRRMAKVEFKPFTPDTPRGFTALREMIGRDRRRGYAVSRGAYQRGIVAFACPIRADGGAAVAALSVVGPAIDLEGRIETEIKDAVAQSAARLSGMLGFRGGAASRRRTRSAKRVS